MKRTKGRIRSTHRIHRTVKVCQVLYRHLGTPSPSKSDASPKKEKKLGEICEEMLAQLNGSQSNKRFEPPEKKRQINQILSRHNLRIEER